MVSNVPLQIHREALSWFDDDCLHVLETISGDVVTNLQRFHSKKLFDSLRSHLTVLSFAESTRKNRNLRSSSNPLISYHGLEPHIILRSSAIISSVDHIPFQDSHVEFDRQPFDVSSEMDILLFCNDIFSNSCKTFDEKVRILDPKVYFLHFLARNGLNLKKATKQWTYASSSTSFSNNR